MNRHKTVFYKGRGALSSPAPRYLKTTAVPFDDGWGGDGEVQLPVTDVLPLDAKTMISRNRSDDVTFDQSINPYRGCEHGCVYCFARPTHAWLDLSPGLDFETRLFYKRNAGTALSGELAAPGYQCKPIMLGANTDAYQPIERHFKVTRRLLEILCRCRHPFAVITKGALVERDIDLLSPMAEQGLAMVWVSLTTLNKKLARQMEPRAAAPHRRLQVIRNLHAAGIPVGVLTAPIIPMLNDNELESMLDAAREAGAAHCGYVLLRLPHEVKDLFEEWLKEHYPGRADRIMNRMRDCHGGKEYDSTFGARMKGRGIYADLIRRRFRNARKKAGYRRVPQPDTSLFTPPVPATPPIMSNINVPARTKSSVKPSAMAGDQLRLI